MAKKFQDLENLNISEPESPPGDPVRKSFEGKTVTTRKQRYAGALPWKSAVCLGDNKKVAEKRFV